MDETYWKQFMTTGKVEDYLQFKGVSDIEENTPNKKESGNDRRERPDAGFGKCNSHCS